MGKMSRKRVSAFTVEETGTHTKRRRWGYRDNLRENLEEIEETIFATWNVGMDVEHLMDIVQATNMSTAFRNDEYSYFFSSLLRMADDRIDEFWTENMENDLTELRRAVSDLMYLKDDVSAPEQVQQVSNAESEIAWRVLNRWEELAISTLRTVVFRW